MFSLQVDQPYPISTIATSPSGLRLILGSSDLVITDRLDRVVWRANAHPVRLRFTDRLELLGASGDVLWQAGSNGTRCSFGNDGVLRITDKAGKTVFSTSAPSPSGAVVTLDRTERGVDEALYSPDGRFSLVLQKDGNLVIYDAAMKPLWASCTILRSLVFGGDGFLRILDQRNHSLWSAPVRGTSCLFDDAGLRIYDQARLVWSAVLNKLVNYTPAPTATPSAPIKNGMLPVAIILIILLILIVILLLIISDDQQPRQQQKTRPAQKK
ncbi:hypothetical protein EBZ80_18765 [bacterium]|nr:hypothetical protein [bacterium]